MSAHHILGLEQYDEAVRYLAEALNRSDSYLDDIREDPALQQLVENPVFAQLGELMDKSLSTT